MSQEDKLVRIRQKTDTAEGWLVNNPILLYGELGLEIDTQLIKIGDGITPWAGLPYVLAEQIDNKVNKDFSNVSTVLANSIIGDTISSNTDIIANNNLKGMSSFTLMGENADNVSTVYTSGPLTAPLYVGTIHANWIYEDWASESYSPYIGLYNSDKDITFSGYLTTKFSPSDYDIVISFDDATMSQYYSEIAECGLYVKADGTMGIGNYEAFYNSILYYQHVTLGVNITIYYTGGGIL